MEIIILIFGIVIDRLTKIWAVGLRNNSSIEIIPNFFSLEYLENRGAAFGVLQNKQLFLIIVTISVMICLFIGFLKFRKKDHLLGFSLILIITGAIGNLYDRIAYNYVIDFISLHYKNIYYFPTFNVADIMVVIGTFLLIIYIIKDAN